MPEIYNLSTLCRCCHSDGTFKSLNTSYRVKNNEEIYETMLADTLGITIQVPPLEASYTICGKCIIKLRQASNFKKQVLLCEQKFIEYCRNEQFLNTTLVLKEEIKTETEIEILDEEIIDNDTTTLTEEENDQNDDNVSDFKQEVKEDEVDIDVDIEYSDDISCTEDNISSDLKEEDPHVIENQENVTKEDQANIKLKENNDESEKETEATDIKIDTSCIIEKKNKNGLVFSCRDCGGNYSKKNLIYRHLYTNHDSLKCIYCEKILKSLNSYKKHTQNHIDKNYVCKFCYKKFHTESDLKTHTDIHLNERAFICDICKKSFKNKTTLRKHILWHLGLNKKKLCDLCGQSFNDNSNLRIHVRAVHEKLRPFVCNICSKTFSAKKHLKSHQIKHSNPDFRYPCELCDRKYATTQSLKVHRLSHDNIFRCKHCYKDFEGRDSLRDHIEQNHDTVFPCPQCGKILCSKRTLARHLEEHSENRLRYACDVCNRKFSQKFVMIRHKKRIHNPEKIEKVKCLKCNRSVSNIISHMKSHDDRKYSCDMCPKSYSENNILTRHKLEVHFGRTFDCEVCGKKFVHKRKLNTHRLKVHKIKPEVNNDNV